MITILMDQSAIEEALINYTEDDLGVDLSGKEVSIKLTAGRNGNGLRAEVNISTSDVETPEDIPESDVETVDGFDDIADVEESTEEPAVSPFD